MNIIFSPGASKARHLNLARPLTLSVLGGLTLVILGASLRSVCSSAAAAMSAGARRHAALREPAHRAEHQLADLRQQLQLRVDAMAMRLGAVNAHVIRLDASASASRNGDIDSREFNFAGDPPSGGPEGDSEG